MGYCNCCGTEHDEYVKNGHDPECIYYEPEQQEDIMSQEQDDRDYYERLGLPPELETIEQPDECKGVFFRATKNAYLNSKGGYVYTERMTPLKRMSCPGCDQCGYLYDDLGETINCMDYGQGPVIKDFIHGAIYKLQVTNVQTDWETGYADSWDIEFVYYDKGYSR